MGSRIAFLLQLLLVFAAVSKLLCVESFLVEEFRSTKRSGVRGLTASLIHRDNYFGNEWLTHREKMERDAARSNLRLQSLLARTKLAGRKLAEAAGSPIPAPGSQDWETPLSDAAVAEYLMQISLGTPAQTLVAIADTGSDLTWLQCLPCQECKLGVCGACSQGSIFDATKSSTFLPLSCSSSTCVFLNETGSFCPVSAETPSAGCEYLYSYGDGSRTIGNIAQEIITIQTVTGGVQTVPNYFFGCSHKATSNSSLLDTTDGLVGLGRGNISFPSQLGTDFGKKFGYCLVNRSAASIVESSPLFFGSDAVPITSTNGPQLQYIPMNTSLFAGPTFYYVGCDGISLNGNPISAIPASAFDIQDFGVGGIFFDSGTTFTFLWDQILTPLVNSLVVQITNYTADTSADTGFPLCYSASWSTWANDYGKGVPIISFQFPNTSGLPLFVDTAWFELNETTVCLAMQGSSANFNIFGNTQQVGYHILYDLENEQIGFVEGDCTGAGQTGPTPGSPAPIASTSPGPIASMGPSQISGSTQFEAMVSEFEGQRRR